MEGVWMAGRSGADRDSAGVDDASRLAAVAGAATGAFPKTALDFIDRGDDHDDIETAVQPGGGCDQPCIGSRDVRRDSRGDCGRYGRLQTRGRELFVPRVR